MEGETGMNNGVYECVIDLAGNLEFVNVRNNEAIMHFHENIEIVYVRSGKIEYTNNMIKRILFPGDLLFIPPYFSHKFHSLGKTDSAAVVIPGKYLMDYRQEFGDICFPQMTDLDLNREVYTLMTAIEKNTENTPELIKIGQVNLLLGYIVTHYPFDKYKESDTLMKDIALYIADHFTEKITLEIVARRFGYNRCYFSKLFNDLFNISLTDYVNNVRCVYIQSHIGKENITELIYKSGFRSPSSYYRHIAKIKKNNFYVL